MDYKTIFQSDTGGTCNYNRFLYRSSVQSGTCMCIQSGNRIQRRK